MGDNIPRLIGAPCEILQRYIWKIEDRLLLALASTADPRVGMERGPAAETGCRRRENHFDAGLPARFG